VKASVGERRVGRQERRDVSLRTGGLAARVWRSRQLSDIVERLPLAASRQSAMLDDAALQIGAIGGGAR
jgi:hypothetical protein